MLEIVQKYFSEFEDRVEYLKYRKLTKTERIDTFDIKHPAFAGYFLFFLKDSVFMRFSEK